jgi:carbonyl reductase 1
MRGTLLTVAALAHGAAALKRVLVTGANKGIGREICRRLIADVPDCHVLLGSRSALRGALAVEAILEQEPSGAGRLEMVELDVEDDASVAAAAAAIRAKFGDDAPLYGLCNNAGVGFGKSIPATLSANFYSQKRVAEAMAPLLEDGGRVCNIASASGPNYVAGLADPAAVELFTSKDTTYAALEAELQRQAAMTDYEGVSYGLSKAAVNSWTRIFARDHPRLRINSCSPGYVLTDLTRGMGATKTPEQSNCHVAPLHLLFGEVPFPEGNGRYYGSDAVRSPLDRYRGPGDPPYVSDD